MPSSSIRIAALLAALVAATSSVAQQSYPNKPVRLILPYPPGGTTDFVAREVMAKFSEAFGHQFIVDSRPGAGTLIGLGLGAKAAPDGYTITFATSAGLAVLPALGAKMPFDPVKDFTPIGLMVNVPYILVATAALPANNIKELIALAKAQPGKINVASPGVGTPNHLGIELLNMMAGINVVHVPYKGGAAAVADLAGGQVQLLFSGIPQVSAMLQAKRIKTIALATLKPTPMVPGGVPIADTLPGFTCGTWFGLVVPTGTPRDIVTRLNAEMIKALTNPSVIQRLAAQGVDATPSTPEGLTQQAATETARWREVIKRAGITLESAR